MKKYNNFNEFIEKHEGVSELKVSEALLSWEKYQVDYENYLVEELNKKNLDLKELVEKMNKNPISYSFNEIEDDYNISYYIVNEVYLNRNRIIIKCDVISIEFDINFELEVINISKKCEYFYDAFQHGTETVKNLSIFEINYLKNPLEQIRALVSKIKKDFDDN